MSKQEAYIVVDIGTGNARVAVTTTSGVILSVKRDDVVYIRDDKYEDSIFFEPDYLWNQIKNLTQQALAEAGEVEVLAITASSQREGIVILDQSGKSLLGMPNIDHRGRKWEANLADKDLVYNLSGRYPTSLFSAFKLVGVREVYPELFAQINTFVSISDWVQFKFSGIATYEHSQASETLLYDVDAKDWSSQLVDLFQLPSTILPPLKHSGSVVGPILPKVAQDFNISASAQVVVGGGDTQLAIRSMDTAANDVVIVSGTTTPIIKIVDTYIKDEEQRTWTSRHIDEHNFILEANAGVTGLNLQRLKEIFYPNEGYDIMERELEATTDFQCVASLGSLIADEEKPVIRGGFMFNTPVSHELTRGSFIFAILWDIACSIYENYKFLHEVSSHEEGYIWACGGGMESRFLRQYLADLLGKHVRICDTFRQASVLGGVFICNDALGRTNLKPTLLDETTPQNQERAQQLYQEWKKVRQTFKQANS